MKISDEGVRLVKSFEGYLKKTSDGGCTAYRCPAGVATLGWGCTEGVYMGLVWTKAQAEAALRRELEKFERAVDRLVTVRLNQNEFDALVSLTYNIGEGALKRSTILRRLNAGDRNGAADAFGMWTRGGGRVLPGLVSRRAREAALFRKPMEQPAEPFMPQAVEPAIGPVSRPTIAVATSCATAVATQAIPAVPETLMSNVSTAQSWTAFGDQMWTLKSFATAQPILALGLVAVCLGLWLWPRAQS